MQPMGSASRYSLCGGGWRWELEGQVGTPPGSPRSANRPWASSACLCLYLSGRGGAVGVGGGSRRRCVLSESPGPGLATYVGSGP